MLKHLCLSKTLAALAVSLSVGLPAVTAEIAKPNILFILADDMGYGDCTAYNSESKVVTPNLDRLAKEGLLFTDAHSASATCTASRYGLLTGINPARRGVVNGICQLGPVLEEKEVTIAELLRDQGYVTRMVGKWHLGFEMKPSKPRSAFDFSKPLAGGPLDHGFDSFLGLRQAVSAAPYFYIRGREPESIPTETTSGTKTSAKADGKDPRTAFGAGEMAPGFVHEATNSRLCDEVVKLIRDHAAAGDDTKPFLLYYAMLEPHTPWLPTERFGGKSGAGPYGDYLVQMDHEVGRALEALDETGLDENTLVVFSSDNGAMWPEADIQKWGHRANGTLAGGKARPEEGGHRVPFIARWPGRIPAGTTTDAIINHTDFLATLAELFEVDLAEAVPEAVKDSHSFLSVLTKPGAAQDRSAMAVTAGSFRKGDWKLTFNRGPRSAGPEERDLSNASLYNLAEDLGETQDLSESQPGRKEQLFAAYREYFADRKLKPLAEQVAAKKSQKKGGSPQAKPKANSKAADPDKPMPAPRRASIPADADLTESQKASVEVLVADYRKRRSSLLKKQADLLTEEQRESSEVARKQALEDGKKGVALRAATDAGANLTEEQKKRLSELRESMGQLTREYRDQLQRVLKGGTE